MNGSKQSPLTESGWFGISCDWKKGKGAAFVLFKGLNSAVVCWGQWSIPHYNTHEEHIEGSSAVWSPPAPHLSLWGWFTAAVYHYTSGEIHSENIWRRSKLPRLQWKARFWIRIDKRNIFCMKMFSFLFERWGHRNLGCKIQRRVFRLQEKKSWWRCRTVKLLLLLPPSFFTSSTSEVLWFLQLWMCHVGFQEEETCSVFVSSMESVLSLWTQI